MVYFLFATNRLFWCRDKDAALLYCLRFPHKCTPFSILIGVLLSLYFSLSLCTMHNVQHACFQIFITNMNRTPNDRKINGKRDSKTLKRNGKNEITKIEMIERKNTSNCECVNKWLPVDWERRWAEKRHIRGQNKNKQPKYTTETETESMFYL